MLSRRDFGLAALATAPLLTGFTQSARGIKVGVQSFSFRDMLGKTGDGIDNLIGAIRAVGLDDVEIFEPTIFPYEIVKESGSSPEMQAAIYGHPATGEPMPAQIALREKIRSWRLGTPMAHFAEMRRRFNNAGIRVRAFNFTLKEYCTDAEVDWGFAATRVLGADTLSAGTTLRMAQRAVPFATRHRVRLGLYGHTNVQDPNELATPESFEKGLAMSPFYGVDLDIGHFSAAGFDPVAFIEKHHDRIISIHVKDRKNNNGPNTALGEGDTPVIPVLRLIRDRRWPITAFVEYDYQGGPSVEAVQTMLHYIDSALA